MSPRRGWWAVVCFVLASPALSLAQDAFSTAARSGDSLNRVLTELNQRGYHIAYSSAVVTEDMKIASPPDEQDFDAWMAELLKPWRLHAIKTTGGDYLIVRGAVPLRRANEAMDLDRSTHRPASLETIDVTATRFGIAGD